MFNKPSRVFDLGMWRMLFDVARFNTSAMRVLCEEGDPSIGEYLKREGYSTEFRDNCLIVCSLTHHLLAVTNLLLIDLAHDGCSMEHPAGCNCHQLPSQDPDSLPV